MNKYLAASVGSVGLLSLLLGGCASSSSSRTPRYPTAHASMAHKLERGRIVSTRDVVIDGYSTLQGTALGAGVGGAIGVAAVGVKQSVTVTDNSIEVSSNTGQRAVAGAVGAVVGAVAARHIEKQLTTIKAQELIIEMEETGERIVVVQERREPEFVADEIVQVYTTRMGTSKVFHSEEDPFVDPDTKAYIPDGAATETEFEPVTW